MPNVLPVHIMAAAAAAGRKSLLDYSYGHAVFRACRSPYGSFFLSLPVLAFAYLYPVGAGCICPARRLPALLPAALFLLPYCLYLHKRRAWLSRCHLLAYLAQSLAWIAFAGVVALVGTSFLMPANTKGNTAMLQAWVWLIGGLFLVAPAHWCVQRVLQHYTPQHARRPGIRAGKPNTGSAIGILERLIIYICIAGNHFTMAGMVLGAKSLLRLTETRDTKRLSEYILLGSLLSFLLATAAAMGAKYVLN